MKACAIVKCMESANRFNMYIVTFMSVCHWLLSQFTGKSSNFFSKRKFGDISVLSFFKVITKIAEVGGRRVVAVLPPVIALQSNMSFAVWLHGLLLTWEKTTYSQ